MLFSKVIGHQQVKNRLIQSVNDGRISHAQLFAGHPGGGCLALAVAYTRYINCENRQETDSCGVCPSCIKMNKLIHPDVHFTYPVAGPLKPKSIDFIVPWRAAFLANPYMEVQEWFASLEIENKQGFISVDEAADIIRKLSLKSFESEYKTVIIWLPEKMRVEASNALLKILEEPPDKTLFLLVTENQEQLIPTIVSRTQLVKTGLLSDTEVIQALVEEENISADEATRWARMCEGNFNSALRLADRDLEEKHTENDFIEWMRCCYQPEKFFPELMERTDRFARLTREGQKDYLALCMTILRECLLMNLGVKSLLRFGDKGQELFSRFSALVHTGNMKQFEETLNRAIFHTERNANAKILFLDLSFKVNKILMIKKPESEKITMQMNSGCL